MKSRRILTTYPCKHLIIKEWISYYFNLFLWSHHLGGIANWQPLAGEHAKGYCVRPLSLFLRQESWHRSHCLVHWLRTSVHSVQYGSAIWPPIVTYIAFSRVCLQTFSCKLTPTWSQRLGLEWRVVWASLEFVNIKKCPVFGFKPWPANFSMIWAAFLGVIFIAPPGSDKMAHFSFLGV